jgi:hypothetical protein
VNERNSETREAVKRIKEAIYDVQIGEAEIQPARSEPGTFIVMFDSRAGNAAKVTVHTSQDYDLIVRMLKRAHED